MNQVNHFGLHQEDAIAWLIQGRGGSNFVGVSKQCPFKNPKGMCNHLIPVAAPIPDKLQWEKFRTVLKDPLVEVMLPIPRKEGDRAFYIEDPYDDLSTYLSNLSRLSSPINSICRPVWMIEEKDVMVELQKTNIQPWIITQMDVKKIGLLNTIAKSTNYFPRTVIITGSATIPIPKEIKKLKTKIRDFPLDDLITLPMESIGATALRRYVRNEVVDSPMESRQDRRDRQIRERTKTQ